VPEEEDELEKFDWWVFDDEDTYYAMSTKHKIYYNRGDQLFNCYGKADMVKTGE